MRCKTRGNNRDDRAVIKGVWLNKNYLLKDDDIRDNSTVIDLGAHIGIFSVFAASHAKNVKVLSYEPFPENYSMLLENIEMNGLQKSIIPFNIAISDSKKKIKLFVDERSTVGHSAIVPHEQYINVDAISLIDIFEDNKIQDCDLLKMDIEGSEYAVLYNAPRDVFKKIGRIYLEYEDINSSSHLNHKSLQKYLENNGFQVFHKKPILYAVRHS